METKTKQRREAGGAHTWKMPEGVRGRAVFSADGEYRYALWREWAEPSKKYAAFIGLNPSTAAEDVDDPTVRKCQQLAKRWGFDAMVMLNLYAYRTTDPARLYYEGVDPVGPMNNATINALTGDAYIVVACWGASKGDRINEVRAIVSRPLYCLGETKFGGPRHPLYVPLSTEPQRWR